MEGKYHFEMLKFVTRSGGFVETVIEVDDDHPNPYILHLLEKTKHYRAHGY